MYVYDVYIDLYLVDGYLITSQKYCGFIPKRTRTHTSIYLYIIICIYIPVPISYLYNLFQMKILK